ncbi:hypothetical protein GCAAIG_06160 [Candidatus Electronema halotolerans]
MRRTRSHRLPRICADLHRVAFVLRCAVAKLARVVPSPRPECTVSFRGNCENISHSPPATYPCRFAPGCFCSPLCRRQAGRTSSIPTPRVYRQLSGQLCENISHSPPATYPCRSAQGCFCVLLFHCLSDRNCFVPTPRAYRPASGQLCVRTCGHCLPCIRANLHRTAFALRCAVAELSVAVVSPCPKRTVLLQGQYDNPQLSRSASCCPCRSAPDCFYCPLCRHQAGHSSCVPTPRACRQLSGQLCGQSLRSPPATYPCQSAPDWFFVRLFRHPIDRKS